jgi:hypothetical protein
MLHPFITAELVHQRRADLLGDADAWRRARPIRRRPGTTGLTSRLKTAARGLQLSARSRSGHVAHGNAAPKGQ